jgi:hypothetical protein
VILGLVREAATQVPLGFVDVRLIPASQELEGLVHVAESRTNGSFEFCSVPVGRYTVQGWFEGVGGDLTQVSVGPGGETSLVLNLTLEGESDQPGSLSGQVKDAETGDPIQGVAVELLAPRRRGVTDEEGRFAFFAIPPDTVVLVAKHLGYQDANGPVVIGGAQAVTVQVAMATRPIEMDPIVVTATRREFVYALPGMEELERRMASGFGEFIVQEQIRDRDPMRVTDLLQGTSVIVMNNGQAIYMQRSLCAPVVYIDDVRITHGSGSSSLKRALGEAGTVADSKEDEGSFAAQAVDLIHPNQIQAIEIYEGPASTPGQYIDSRSRCGVILIWTRRGPKG